MLKIGNFSKLSRISIRMLRHYDDLGLLKPATIDKFTGYRFYDESQLVQAERIQVLKNMGFSLSEIQLVLDKYASPKEMEQFLLLKKQEIELKQQSLNQTLCLLDSTIEWLRKDGNIMGYDVSLKTIPERYVASVRKIIPTYQDEGMLWATLMQESAPLNIKCVGNPNYALAIFHDKEYKENDVDVEIQTTVSGKYSNTENVMFKTEPAVEVASSTFKGSYEKIAQLNQNVANWVSDNGYEFNGPAFWIYHVSPHETQNPDEYVTEVCYPVKKK